MEEVYNFIRTKLSLKTGDVVVAGISGGPDSMALLFILNEFKNKLDLKLVCAHINHNLKEESDKEEEDLRKFCLKNKINYEIYKNLDMDNNGYIGYEEFVRGAVNKHYFVQPFVLKYAFKYFDKDNSGEITFDEIEKLFCKSIPDKTKVHQTLNAIIKEVDINNDKKISYREFSLVMQRMIK